MKSLFEVTGFNRFENNKKMTVSVYGVRTDPRNKRKAEFLVYYAGDWMWTSADYYVPINNKHE